MKQEGKKTPPDVHASPWYLALFWAGYKRICPSRNILLMLLICAVRKRNTIDLLKYKPEEKLWSANLLCLTQMIPGNTLFSCLICQGVLWYLLSTEFPFVIGVAAETFQLSDSSDCLGSNLSTGIHHIIRKDVVLGSKSIISFDSPKLQACPLRAASCWE